MSSANNIVFSIDNVVIDYNPLKPSARDQLAFFLRVFARRNAAELITWNSAKPGTFRDQWSIRVGPNTSFWVGLGLNGAKTDYGRCRIEFNPNKVANTAMFTSVAYHLVRCTELHQRKVARFDLAIDIPVPRERCFLVKDRRLYIERRHGQEYTQYLGAKSSSVGRVKLYNKAIESGLDYPLTRLELTLDPQKSYASLTLPAVYYFDDPNLVTTGVRVSDTDRFILHALLNGFGSVDQLGRKTAAKIKRLLDTSIKRVELQEKEYDAILEQVHQYESDEPVPRG